MLRHPLVVYGVLAELYLHVREELVAVGHLLAFIECLSCPDLEFWIYLVQDYTTLLCRSRP